MGKSCKWYCYVYINRDSISSIGLTIETGERRNLVIRIGMPYWLPDNSFASCPREYEGLFDKVSDAAGIDLIHALHLATDIDTALKFQSKYRFYWPDGSPYFEESSTCIAIRSGKKA